MLIRNQFEVAQPVDKVWRFFADVPVVATCLPGAELTEDLGDERYRGRVSIRMGPVSLRFDGVAAITERDDEARRIVVDASGADERGRGQAAMIVTAKLARAASGTRVDVDQDLQVSGAAAQYGRGMIADVSSVLMREFATNLQAAIARAERGETAAARHAAAPARGFTIGLQATLMALKRVFRRFFASYPSTPA
ncbi:SRPBCC family protein [Amycolatopsis carbonis]|uniref:SRPBCC family protein n=1 Tax=Amycolatopsis carbonis TaxID=715471 RepID=A0A9Y2IB87_9PSEU|nr:SRPBCC family protein [Amycolatopsis sp. 2-15]WIX75801.1 SRPBCC family protein [Amycolatopsis sp. 2-15]